ncbi:hypothetical protein [Thermoactinomyces sp. DSM 45892]|uniref:hypothetical protein n=1 Tax=Thermoactinomyces sp. DSM 45892 TaxID=1882753 RepID=UPI00089486F9|nr:hypothetical protein [Thermoactinomyces sp. DSM 45892]SDX95865.1 hypothetical protein SAMN05444416_101103 [Thermoactinomyces sp. DSM 45892]
MAHKNVDRKHIVFYSGGLGSWMTAKLVIEKYGKENIILLFTDTLIEDKDLYRFLNVTEEHFGIQITRIADGRTPWQVFRDNRWLGNARVAPCSHHLKQKTARKWIEANFLPNECTLYLGIDWTEMHRRNAPIKNWHPYQVEFPLCEEPYISKQEIVGELANTGIELPKLYKLGFSHNNCGGICVRGGQGHWIHLLKTIPERYLEAEQKEQEMREFLQKDVTILSRQRNGKKHKLTLRTLRKEYEQDKPIDILDIGGCGCFVDNEPDQYPNVN